MFNFRPTGMWPWLSVPSQQVPASRMNDDGSVRHDPAAGMASGPANDPYAQIMAESAGPSVLPSDFSNPTPIAGPYFPTSFGLPSGLPEFNRPTQADSPWPAVPQISSDD